MAERPWLLSAGVRYSKMKVSVNDHYLSNGNDSGSWSSATDTGAGLLYKLTPNVNVSPAPRAASKRHPEELFTRALVAASITS